LVLTIYQHGGKCTKLPQNIPNGHKNIPNMSNGRKIDQSPKNIPTSPIARPSKIYPNQDFRFEKNAIWQQ
jgi:hypothetical protein